MFDLTGKVALVTGASCGLGALPSALISTPGVAIDLGRSFRSSTLVGVALSGHAATRRAP